MKGRRPAGGPFPAPLTPSGQPTRPGGGAECAHAEERGGVRRNWERRGFLGFDCLYKS